MSTRQMHRHHRSLIRCGRWRLAGTLVAASMACSPIVCASVTAADPDVRFDGARIEERTAPVWFEEALKMVGCEVGPNGRAVLSGRLSDRLPLGGPSSAEVICIRLEDITLRTTAPVVRQAVVTVTCAFSATAPHDLLAAWTASKDEWTATPVEHRPVEAEINGGHQKVYWEPGSGPGRSTVCEILKVLMRKGVPLADVGQVVLRPRTVVSNFPVDGTPGPNPPRLFWTAVLKGYVAHTYEPHGYATQRVTLIADDAHEVFINYFMP